MGAPIISIAKEGGETRFMEDYQKKGEVEEADPGITILSILLAICIILIIVLIVILVRRKETH